MQSNQTAANATVRFAWFRPLGPADHCCLGGVLDHHLQASRHFPFVPCKPCATSHALSPNAHSFCTQNCVLFAHWQSNDSPCLRPACAFLHAASTKTLGRAAQERGTGDLVPDILFVDHAWAERLHAALFNHLDLLVLSSVLHLSASSPSPVVACALL